MIAFISNSRKHKSVQIEIRAVFARSQSKGTREKFLGDCSDGYMTAYICQNTLNYTLLKSKLYCL